MWFLLVIGFFFSATRAEARPTDASWYVGLPVANVVLQAPEGGLPEESLEPLLRTIQGESFRIRNIQLDLATLYRVGEFAEVEAHVEPWFIMDFAGNTQEAVLVQYRVRPAPLVQRVHIQGARSFPEQQLLNVLKINTGQHYYQDIDAPRTAEALSNYLHREGFPAARVEVDVESLDAHNVEVWVRIDEGEPNLLNEINFIGDLSPEVTKEDLQKWAEKGGLVVGKPFKEASVRDAHQIIVHELGSFGGPFEPYRGWVSARVTPAVIQDREKGVTATMTIELGLRLKLDVHGLGWRGERQVRDTLDIDERLRITQGFLEEAPERLRHDLQEHGYYQANVSVRLLQSRDSQTLKIRAERGPTFTVGRYVFKGNQNVESRLLESIMKQASPDVLRLGYFTERDLELGLSAASAYYKSAGYQEAKITFDEITTSDAPRDSDAPRRINLHISVDEGQQTTQASIWVEDAAIDVDVDIVREARENLSNNPFSPLLIERLANQVVEKHREAGYLEASARVIHNRPMPDRVESIIDVSPGPKVLLRSVVTRGTKTVRPSFVRREVDLMLGEPLASTRIEGVRRALYDLGVFRSVGLELLGDEDVRDLVIAVQERPRWGFELGGGLSTDQGVRSFTRLTRRNLFGRAHMLDIYGVVGLEYGAFLQPEWRFAVNYTAPRFPIRNQRLILELLARERLQERTWTLGRTAGNAAIEWDLNEYTQLRSQIRLEARQLLKVDTGTLIQGEPWTTMIALDNPTLPSPVRYKDSLAVYFLRDRRDSVLQTSAGIANSLSAEWSPGIFVQPVLGEPTSVPFVKAEGRISGHIPLGGVELSLTAQGGHGFTYAGGILPLEDRYRLGGTGSLRGYTRDSIGPRNQASRVDSNWPNALSPVIDYTLRDSAERWAPTGGDTRAMGIAEVLVPFQTLGMARWDGYAFALFTDVGNVWLLNANASDRLQRSQYVSEEPPVRIGSGLGLRVLTPVGPFQLDLAANPQAAFARGARAVLLRDQYEEPPMRIHLTLGDIW